MPLLNFLVRGMAAMIRVLHPFMDGSFTRFITRALLYVAWIFLLYGFIWCLHACMLKALMFISKMYAVVAMHFYAVELLSRFSIQSVFCFVTVALPVLITFALAVVVEATGHSWDVEAVYEEWREHTGG